MQLPEECELIRIFIGEQDTYDDGEMQVYYGRPRYEVIIAEARRHGLAGATAFRGLQGYGANSRIHGQSDPLRLSEDLPVAIEIVDRTDRIDGFLPVLDQLVGEGLITREKVRVVAYRPKNRGQ